ncbi:DUF4007 family protein [Spirosoma profusum]|nr:DUF4007 family protein [Spirosoma profusum]
MIQFRYSGHETFACRYAWLPKAYSAIKDDPFLFSNENEAMVRLGVGKNMVRAIKFWVQLTKVAVSEGQGLTVTPFGKLIFEEKGLDPYMEDIQTLWLLHWKMTAHPTDPMFAWYFMLNQWPAPDFTRSEVVEAFIAETKKQERLLSTVTLEQHLDIFLHTYRPPRIRRASIAEDSLDCPLTELRLIQHSGERALVAGGRREEVYTFRRDSKPEISNALLAYCLYDYWQLHRPHEASLTFREVSVLPNSIGQVFKLSEIDLRDRLESMNRDPQKPFEFQASAALPRIIKHRELNNEQVDSELLQNIYNQPAN